MLEVLTLLNKVERVSRVIDPANFVSEPGIWAKVESDGSLVNADGSAADINKMVMTSSSSNIYESHDVEVGRITTLESIGTRCKVDGEGYAGSPSQGDLLFVSTDTGNETEGKLVSVTENPGSESGDHEVVARCEEENSTEGWIIFRTISPTTVSL